MVVQWEDRFYDSNRGHTYLGNPDDMKQIYPDYVEMIKGFGLPVERGMYKRDLKAALQRMLDSDEAYVLTSSCHTPSTCCPSYRPVTPSPT